MSHSASYQSDLTLCSIKRKVLRQIILTLHQPYKKVFRSSHPRTLIIDNMKKNINLLKSDNIKPYQYLYITCFFFLQTSWQVLLHTLFVLLPCRYVSKDLSHSRPRMP